MKKYISILLVAAIPVLFASACGNHDNTEQTDTDTSINTLPVENTTSSPQMTPGQPGDTMATPRIDPALDSAAKQGTMPPK